MNLLWFLPVFSFLYMSAWFLVSLKVKRYDVIDVAWGPAFVIIALMAIYFRESSLDARSLWLLLLIFLWAARLLWHTFKRNLRQEDDWRYHRWHEKDGACRYSICTFVQVFLLQAALLMIISLPLVYSLRLITLNLFDINYFALALAFLGLALEAVADWQRTAFLNKVENKDRLMTRGLWRFSRHPNYLGEIIFWWGIYFLVWGAPKSWMLIISPLTITYVLLFVSGLPTEKKYQGRADFLEYKRKTSPLLLWPPKK